MFILCVVTTSCDCDEEKKKAGQAGSPKKKFRGNSDMGTSKIPTPHETQNNKVIKEVCGVWIGGGQCS